MENYYEKLEGFCNLIQLKDEDALNIFINNLKSDISKPIIDVCGRWVAVCDPYEFRLLLMRMRNHGIDMGKSVLIMKLINETIKVSSNFSMFVDIGVAICDFENNMGSGYAQNGCFDKALNVCKEMKNSSKFTGVNVHYFEYKFAPTETCVVCVKGGEWLFIANLSAVNCYKSEHLKRPENWALIKKAKYFYLIEFFLIVFPNSIQIVDECTTTNHKVFLINSSAPFIYEFFKDA
ncbi:hypothetical protein CRYUN_Cryun14cG0050700 [Craigia yunnanensis]